MFFQLDNCLLKCQKSVTYYSDSSEFLSRYSIPPIQNKIQEKIKKYKLFLEIKNKNSRASTRNKEKPINKLFSLT